MAQSRSEIDSLLNEVSSLADQAVMDVVGSPATAPVSSGDRESRVAFGEGPRRDSMRRILRIEVPVIVLLAQRTIPLVEIVNLTSGAILEFDKNFDSDLDLMINNKCIGQGQAVKIGENFGLRIQRIGSLRQRIEAMGSDD
jgi:flagellar motor switch protein FliN/FliY